MSSITVSIGDRSRTLPLGRALFLLAAVVLVAVAIAVGRWSASTTTTDAPGQEQSAPAASTPAAEQSPQYQPGRELSGGLFGGGSVCLLARPC